MKSLTEVMGPCLTVDGVIRKAASGVAAGLCLRGKLIAPGERILVSDIDPPNETSCVVVHDEGFVSAVNLFVPFPVGGPIDSCYDVLLSGIIECVLPGSQSLVTKVDTAILTNESDAFVFGDVLGVMRRLGLSETSGLEAGPSTIVEGRLDAAAARVSVASKSTESVLSIDWLWPWLVANIPFDDLRPRYRRDVLVLLTANNQALGDQSVPASAVKAVAVRLGEIWQIELT